MSLIPSSSAVASDPRSDSWLHSLPLPHKSLQLRSSPPDFDEVRSFAGVTEPYHSPTLVRCIQRPEWTLVPRVL